jgi:predicted TIM-barrel fold metal-dependent hydrolase
VTVPGFPADIGAVDVYISLPHTNPAATTDRYRSVLKDSASHATKRHPAEYMFKDIPPAIGKDDDAVAILLHEMDRHGIQLAVINVDHPDAPRALAEHPDRFRASVVTDPNDVTNAVRKVRDAAARYDLHAAVSFPAGVQVAINDRRYYPIYQTCIDLDIPIIMNAGVAGPRFPSVEIQYVGHFDQVCYDLPELKVVMCHGGEPWEELAVKLMLKYPGLHYCTSAFAPKYYPKAIIDYANTRGADKIIYAGYYPSGLSLERIFRELPDVPLRGDVWPKFLRENAMRVFRLDEDLSPGGVGHDRAASVTG